MKETIKMTLKEAERLSVMKQVDNKNFTIKKASEELGLSLRQTKRIRKRYKKEGERGLISIRRGKVSNRKIPETIKKQAVKLIKAKYPDFGPTLASEKLEENHKIKISEETIRKWLIEEGLWQVKRKKQTRVYQRRTRRSRFGELVQADGSPEKWFEERGEKCTLIQFVDDATSATTKARFAKAETTADYLKVLREHLEAYGRPVALYVDRHSIFRVNKQEIEKGEAITHFGQVLKELDIELICAHSPQAKGRVERKNRLFQDRLIKEMRLKNINTIEEANKYLPEFLEKINKKFGKEPADQQDAHRELRSSDDLEKMFARKEERKLSKNLTMQYQREIYMIQTQTPHRLRHAKVIVYAREGHPITIEYKGKELQYRKWSELPYERPAVLDSKQLETWGNTQGKKPRKHHPWR